MLFLSSGIVYWLQILRHCCDNNALFIINVSRVIVNSLPQKIGKKQNQSVHIHCISENFQWYTKKRIKSALDISTFLNYLTSFDNTSIFVVKHQSFTKFSIRSPVSR